nr:RNA polymerase recycling motor ATPase HelR [Leifsonia sp. AK011]
MSARPTPSAFDLPERLAAKNTPALIAADERHFAEIARNLDRMTAELAARLDELRLVRGDSGREVAERDDEIRRLSSRLRAIGRYGIDLCLGRMVPAGSSEPIYIGRFGLTDETGKRLLIDWRSPAAEPFFGATHAHPDGLASRRRYRWTLGRITDYWDEVFEEGAIDTSASLDDQSAFVASLGASRSPRMRDVLSTIQADQDAIIRADSRGALVVDGGPGTGKTVVALHRTAYLLYSDARVSAGGVLFVGPSTAYLAYVEDVLPSLGEDSVQVCTLRELVAEGGAAVAETDAAVASLKSSARLVSAVDAAVDLAERAPRAATIVETPWADVRIEPADWQEAFAAVEPGTPHNQAREQVWQALVEIVADRLGLEQEEGPDEFDAYGLTRQASGGLGRLLAADEQVAAALSRAWPLLGATDLIAGFWSSPELLRRVAPWLDQEDVAKLQRRTPQAWTLSDLPLLDAAQRRLGDPDAAVRARRREAEAAAERARRAEVTADLIASDDSEMRVMSMLRGQDLRAALEEEAEALRVAPDALAGPFAHIVVDEAQELTDAEWQMLLARCPSRSFTIVGDRAQARRGFRESWNERLERVGFGRVAVASLGVNYRTPAEVMAVAEPVIRAALPDANVPVSIRENGVPVMRADAAELESLVETWLLGHPEGIACVIAGAGFDAAPFDRFDRVRVLTPELSKGLEFDLVLLVEPESFGDGIAGAVDRYVAMTRATQQLVLVTA